MKRESPSTNFTSPLKDGISYIGLTNVAGNDVSIVNSARVSFAKRVSKVSKKDAKLIAFLAKHNHGTPFEHNMLTFEVKAPLFVFREWHRHRVGWSYNEWSMRYIEGGKDVDFEFYVPSCLRYQSKSNRQGSSGKFKSKTLLAQIRNSYEESYSLYRILIEKKVAKELARCVLPVATYSCMWATCNLRSLFHFLTLRLAPGAQEEIRVYAKQMMIEAEKHFPVAMKMWRETHGYDKRGNPVRSANAT
jgi:thymidylate synthase (FAD)